MRGQRKYLATQNKRTRHLIRQMYTFFFFLWLCSMVPSLIFYAYPITLGLALFFFITLFIWRKAVPRQRINWHHLIYSSLLGILILIYGTICRAGDNLYPKPHSNLAPYVVHGLLIIQLMASCFFVYKTPRGGKLFKSAMLSWIFYLSMSAGFVALMSVSGVWL